MHVVTSGVMKPASYICVIDVSVVAPQTPACVVTRRPSSRAASKAPLLGELRGAGHVERELQSEHVVGRLKLSVTKERNSGAFAHSHGAPR